MPGKSFRPCLQPGCSNVTQSKYCDQHTQKATGNRTTAQRGYDYAWQQTRMEVLKRDKYLCRNCLKSGRPTPAEHVHHIKKIATHPKLRLDKGNLLSVCKACHIELEKQSL